MGCSYSRGIKKSKPCLCLCEYFSDTVLVLPTLLTSQVTLCFSPVGHKLRVRSRKFPAILNCTAIDWFHEWPQQALESVSLRFLQNTDSIEVRRAGDPPQRPPPHREQRAPNPHVGIKVQAQIEPSKSVKARVEWAAHSNLHGGMVLHFLFVF